MREERFDFYNALNDLTDLLSEFLYKEICKESSSSFYSYVYENLSTRSKDMCKNIDDLFQLDLNPLIAVIHQLKGIIIGMKLVNEPIFFSYLAVIQQIRNITFHKSRNSQVSEFQEINWVSTLNLVLDELPKSLKKENSYKVIKKRVSDYFEKISNKNTEGNSHSETKKISKTSTTEGLEIITEEDKLERKINNLEKKKEEIISLHMNERLNSCILKRTIFIKLLNFIKENSSINFSEDKFISLIGEKEFNKISENQKQYLEEIIKIIND